MKVTIERSASSVSGASAVVLCALFYLMMAGGIAALLFGVSRDSNASVALGAGFCVLGVIAAIGFAVVQPNTTTVLTLFGAYVGNLYNGGLHMINPFATRVAVSLKMRNFNSEKLKVNDHDGNPIEIAAVVVWQIQNAVKATFDVENVEAFVALQAETAIRAIASRYPYDSRQGESLRGSSQTICEELTAELNAKLAIAGVHVAEARFSHLAYAQEIASAMLRRQQAQAVLSARQTIVEGAVGMVKQALEQLKSEGVVDLDEDKKAQMVNNLLVALVSENNASPVINAGTIY